MKRFIVLTAMAAVLAGSVFGQALPSLVTGSGFTSPQATATAGRIRSVADDFMRPDSFKNVSFENWFGMTSFSSTTNAGLGYATKVGGLYLGLYYGGSFWANIQTFSRTDSNGVKSYTTLPTFNANLPLNQLAVLIGLENMGFRLTLTSSYKHFKDSDFIVDGGTEGYKSYEMGNGAISPQLAWSMTGNLTEKGIKPWATVDLLFNDNFAKGQQYDDTFAYTTGVVNGSIKYTRFDLNLGLGGYTIANKNNWRTSVDLEYRLGINFYNSDYTYTDVVSDYERINSFHGRNSTADGLDVYKSSNHRIRPSISTQWNGEALRLRAKLDLNFNITATDSAPVEALPGGSLYKEGRTATTTIFGINPDLSLGAQWQIHPRFFLNIGGRINVAALNITTTKGATYTANNKDFNSDYKTTASTFGSTENRLTLGATFNAKDNLSFEASCGVANTGAGNNAVSVFEAGTNGLFYFGGILATLKF